MILLGNASTCTTNTSSIFSHLYFSEGGIALQPFLNMHLSYSYTTYSMFLVYQRQPKRLYRAMRYNISNESQIKKQHASLLSRVYYSRRYVLQRQRTHSNQIQQGACYISGKWSNRTRLSNVLRVFENKTFSGRPESYYRD